MTPAGSVTAPIEVVGSPLLDASTIADDGPDGGTRSMPDVRDGGTAVEPALVSEVTAAVGRPAATSDDDLAVRDQHPIPTITAHTPAVIASQKMSPASLSRRPATIEAASVGMVHSCTVVFDREHWLVNKV